MNPASPPPTPRLIGRSVRLLLGAALLYFLAQLLYSIPQASGFLAARPGSSVPGGNWWIGTVICFLALGLVVNSGFSRRWGAWPQIVYLGLVGAAVLWDRLAYRAFWATPLAVLVLVLVGYVLAHAGISYVVAGVAATPG